MPESLPPFAFTSRVTASQALCDKVELVVGSWILEGNTENIDQFRERMTLPGRGINDWSGFQCLFNRPETAGQWRRPMEFRTVKRSDPRCPRKEPPLWSGKWVFGVDDERTSGDNARYITKLDVSINPTKFSRFQYMRLHPQTRQPIISDYTFFGLRLRRGNERVPAPYANEFALDGNDNWLPQGPRLILGEQPWRDRLMAACFDGFPDRVFIAAMNEAAEDRPEILAGFAPTVNLKTCETYFEFASDDPVALVKSLEETLVEFGRGTALIRHYPFTHYETGRECHSPFVRVTAGPGRDIRVYAKTNRRIRLEVKHNMVCANPFILRGANGSSGHTRNSWDGFYEMIALLNEDAASLINELLAFIESRQGIIPSPITAQMLVQRVLRAVPDIDHAWPILELLARENRILGGILPRSFDGPLAALCAAEILQPHSGRVRGRCYAVAPEYRAGLQNLRYLFQPTMACRVRQPPRSSNEPRVRLPSDALRPRVRQPRASNNEGPS